MQFWVQKFRETTATGKLSRRKPLLVVLFFGGGSICTVALTPAPPPIQYCFNYEIKWNFTTNITQNCEELIFLMPVLFLFAAPSKCIHLREDTLEFGLELHAKSVPLFGALFIPYIYLEIGSVVVTNAGIFTSEL